MAGSGIDRGERCRFGDGVALEKVATEGSDMGQLVIGLDSLSQGQSTEILTDDHHGRDQLASRRRLVNPADQLPIELHDLRLERRQAVEAGVAGAQIIECHSVADLS